MKQQDFLALIDRKLNDLQVPYALVGAFASTAYGEPRFTQDIDMVVEYDSNQIDAFLQAFPAPVFYLSRQALEDGTNQRVPFNILHTTTGHKVDLIPMRRESWASQQLQRRRRLELFPGIFAWIASPEDTILGKLWYYQLGGSDKHLRDIVGILKIQQHRLDDQFLQQGIEKIGAADIWISIQDKLKESP